MNRVLFDTNVLLDIAISRPEFAESSMAAYEQVVAHAQPPLIAPHSLATFYYLVKQSHGREGAEHSIEDLLATGEIGTFDGECAEIAVSLGFSDFEDAMIAACAQKAGADCIVTRNMSDFRDSPVEAFSPEDFLERIKKDQGPSGRD